MTQRAALVKSEPTAWPLSQQQQHPYLTLCSEFRNGYIRLMVLGRLTEQTLGLDLRTSAFLSLLPWAVMAIGSTSAGLLADGLIRRGTPVKAVRKVLLPPCLGMI